MVSVNPAVPRANDDTPLVLRAIQRDQDAFGELYDRHVSRVYKHIYYMVGNSAEAEDLTAQTFLKAWEAIPRYKERGAPFVAWLLRIAHNLTVSHLRSRREHSELDEGFVDSKRMRNPEEALVQSTEERSVREAVLQLRDEQRQVIMLRFVEEMPRTPAGKIRKIDLRLTAAGALEHTDQLRAGPGGRGDEGETGPRACASPTSRSSRSA